MKNCTKNPGSNACLIDGVQNITEAGSLQTAAPQMHERLAKEILDNAPDGVLLINSDGRIAYANATMAEICGYSTRELIEKNLEAILPHEISAHHQALVRNYFKAPRRRVMGTKPMLGEASVMAQVYDETPMLGFQLVHKQGHRIRVDVALAPHGVPGDGCVVAFVRDIEHLARLESELARQADHDSLTGLPNRRQLNVELHRAVVKAQRYVRRFGLLLLDLNGFKEINDQYGHAVGDRVLQEISRRLESSVRSSDLLARLGGDEFVVLMPEIGANLECHDLASKILRSISAPMELQGLTFNLTASIGYSCYPSDGHDAESLLRYADMAMYRAKKRQGNSVVAYDTQMAKEIDERVQIQERLRKSLATVGLELHYQPQVDPHSGVLSGAEALLRWTDPVLGKVSPDRVVLAIESTDLIHRLGGWVLETAFAQLAKWNQCGWRMRVSVNLSARQFLNENLERELIGLLEKHRVHPSQIELEITETHAMESLKNTASILRRLSAVGFRLALDDFGEGYSNFAHLQKLPVHHLKFSREFIRDIAVEPESERLLRAMVSMAKALEFSVVAEGVETLAQRDWLCQIGCDLVQGWYYDKALTADEFQEKWLSSGRRYQYEGHQPTYN